MNYNLSIFMRSQFLGASNMQIQNCSSLCKVVFELVLKNFLHCILFCKIWVQHLLITLLVIGWYQSHFYMIICSRVFFLFFPRTVHQYATKRHQSITSGTNNLSINFQFFCILILYLSIIKLWFCFNVEAHVSLYSKY